MSKGKKEKNSLIYKIGAAVIAVLAVVIGSFLKTGKAPELSDVVNTVIGEVGSVIQAETDSPDGEETEPAAAGQTASSPETEVYEEQYGVEVTADSEYDYYLTFANDKLLAQHYEKHGKEMGFDSPEEYEAAANEVVYNTMTMHKTEAEDGDDVYYLESTNEFVVVSTYGYIRTYFNPDDGLDYYNRQ